MQNSIFSKVNVSTRILILTLLCLSILMASSIYLIIFMSIFFIILFILTNKSVKLYIETLKNVKIWLLFIFITYIIIFRNITNSIILIYKIVLIVLFVRQFSLTVNFQKLVSGIKTLLKPIFKRNINDKVSYNVVIFIYYIILYVNSKREIFSKYDLKEKIKYTFSLKYNIMPRIFFTMHKVNKLESSLKLKFSKANFEEKSLKSNIFLFLFIILFIVVFFKEVII